MSPGVLLGLLLVALVVVIGAVALVLRPFQQQLIEVRGRLEALTACQQDVPLALAAGRAQQAEALTVGFQSLQETVGRRLDETGCAVADVRERLGELSQVAQRLEKVGETVAGVQELLQVPKLRGTIGEVWLEELLRQVLPASHYATQHRFKSGERIDAVIRLGERLVPVDSKFPLEACQRMLTASGEQAERERRAFVRSVKARIDEIADKYIRPDEGTYEFALMYIPAENVYYETILRGEDPDKSVLGYALERKVIPVSPHTLYAYLLVILYGLKGLQVEARAREILGELGGLQQQFAKVDEALELLGTHLGRAQQQHEKSVKAAATVHERFARITAAVPDEGVAPKALSPVGT